MLANIDDGTMAHPYSTHTAWMLPLWLCAPIAVLFWRRNVLAVTGFALAVVTLHDLLFGWQGRCGSGLPLAFVLAFLCAITVERAKVWIALLLSTGLVCAVLVVDAITGADVIALAVPITLLVFGVGRAVAHRTEMNRELSRRNEELQDLRDRRAAIEVADDRAQLSQQLDGLLQHRLQQLTYAAESAEGLDADAGPGAAGAHRGREPDDPGRHARDRGAAPRRRRRPRARADRRPPRRAARPAHAGRRAAHGVRRPPLAARDRRAVGVPDRRAPRDRARRPARGRSTSASGSTRTPSRSGCAGRWTRPPTSRPRSPGPRERAKLLGGSVELKVTKGEANAVAQLPVTV